MTRYGVSAGLAILVTFALFWAMQALVSVGYQLLEGGNQLSIDFVRLKRDTAPPPTKREPPKREKPNTPPPPPQITTSKAKLNPGEGVGALAPPIDASGAIDTGLKNTAGSDRGVVPMVRPEPEYPASAEARGVSGWVQVEFTVTKVGSVTDARIVASQPPRVFDRAALAGIKRWRYNPRIKNGQAVDTPGVSVVLEFRP